jgi:hypothetical protein
VRSSNQATARLNKATQSGPAALTPPQRPSVVPTRADTVWFANGRARTLKRRTTLTESRWCRVYAVLCITTTVTHKDHGTRQRAWQCLWGSKAGNIATHDQPRPPTTGLSAVWSGRDDGTLTRSIAALRQSWLLRPAPPAGGLLAISYHSGWLQERLRRWSGSCGIRSRPGPELTMSKCLEIESGCVHGGSPDRRCLAGRPTSGARRPSD